MKKNKDLAVESFKKLEFGTYTTDEMLELSDGKETNGGSTAACYAGVTIVAGWISSNTCPTSACTRAC